MLGLPVPVIGKDQKIAVSSPINTRRLVRFLLDIAVSGLSFLLAILILDGWSAFVDGESLQVLVFSASCAIVYAIAGLSFHSWRFVSIPDAFLLMRDILIANATFINVTFLTSGFTSSAFSVSLIACPITIIALGGMRIFYRCLVEGGLPFGFKNNRGFLRSEPIWILAYGATAETDVFLRALQSKADHPYRVLGIIDDDQCTGLMWAEKAATHGVPIVTGTDAYLSYPKRSAHAKSSHAFLGNGDSVVF